MAAAVESEEQTLMEWVARAALWGIHSIFPPTTITSHIMGKDPISQKKLDQGDGQLLPVKVILGFQGDGTHHTFQLPQIKVDALL